MATASSAVMYGPSCKINNRDLLSFGSQSALLCGTKPQQHQDLVRISMNLTYLQIIMLSFLFSFQVESSQSSQVLLADGFVDRGSTSDTFTIVVSSVGPPVCFGLDVTQDHILDWCRKSRDLR